MLFSLSFIYGNKAVLGSTGASLCVHLAGRGAQVSLKQLKGM